MTAQSLNAVKAALANLHLLRDRGDLGDFACAAAGLRIDDLAAVVALCDDAFTLRQQRDELVEGTERLVDALTEEGRKRSEAEVALAEMTAERDNYRAQRDMNSRAIIEQKERVTNLRAEVERLKREAATVREVLVWAAPYCPPVDAIAFIGNDEDRRLCRTLHSLVTSAPAPVEHGPACYSCGRPRDEHGPRDERGRPGACPAPVEPKPHCPACKAVLGEHHMPDCKSGAWGQVVPSEVPGLIERAIADVLAKREPSRPEPSITIELGTHNRPDGTVCSYLAGSFCNKCGMSR